MAVLALFAAGWTATASATGLPDGRSYELVSPSAKNGADVAADSGRTRAAADGNAVSFMSLGGFGDVHGTGIATEYLAERSNDLSPGSNGWKTHGITPVQKPMSFFGATFGLDPLWVGDFSADLSKGVFRAWSPVTAEDPNVENIENLYRRDDLRAPGAGNYRLVTPCVACGSPIGAFSILQQPAMIGASSDFSHVLFASQIPLTSDAAGSGNVYEWVDGTLRLAGILPDGTPAGGSGTSGTRAISTDGSRIVFSDASTGQVYERIDGTSSVAVSGSERTDCADHDPCSGAPEPDPAGSPQPASYQMASTDGTRVFFISGEQLTDDDHDAVSDLYMWDATKPIGHRLTRLSVDNEPADAPNGVFGVLGASADGNYVYFLAGGQLVAGQPRPGNPLIYVWHDGATPAIAYIGEMALPALDLTEDLLGGSLLNGGVKSRVTPDGKHLLFMSHSGDGLLSAHSKPDYDQTSACAGGCAELYVYSAESGDLACASCNPSGASATVNASDVVRTGTGAAADTDHRNHPLSDDGQHVFFQTAEALVPQDSNGKSDVYEYDTRTGTVQLISSGTDPSDSFFADASADGSNAFFVTRQQLVGWDTDANYDLYDARIGPGFPEPTPSPPTCDGASCRPPVTAPPQASSNVTGTFRGAGNVRSARKKPKAVKCRKGFVRKKVHGKTKCVKRRPAKKAKRAAAQRRAR